MKSKAKKEALFNNLLCACGAKEGEYHHFDKDRCDYEECPFCGYLLQSCSCRYTLLGYSFDSSKPCFGLPKEIFLNGLGEKDQEKWIGLLEKKGRVPYLVFQNICSRCGELNPEFFTVPDEEWKSIIPISHWGDVICKVCYDIIKIKIMRVRNGKEKSSRKKV